MNYQHGLIVCMILETIASNTSNKLGNIYNLEVPFIRHFSLKG